jgi:hypothetical protein
MNLTLKEAIASGKLDEFMKEHANEIGDKAELEAIISSMVRKSPKAQEASPQVDDEN